MKWSKKRVLVTGAEGFIGSHLCNKLLEQNATIFALDSKRVLKNLQTIEKDVNFICGDVTNFDLIKSAIKDVDIVYHLAAQGCVHLSRKKPWETVYTNLIGSLNVLEAARITKGLELVVYPGSDKEYGELSINAFDENHPLDSINSPYDVSKIAADKLFFCYHFNYGIPAVVLRLSNVYGPKQSYRNVIPEFIKQALSYDRIIIGKGNKQDMPTRDFVFVSDVIKAFLVVAEQKDRSIGEVFNIGTGKRTNIVDLAKKILKLLSLPINIQFKGDYSTDIKNEVVSWDKARKLLKWYPNIELEDGLQKTIEYYKLAL